MSTALLFPGQASQKVGMGQDIFEQTALGKTYFGLANEIMGEDITTLIFNGPEEKLRQTKYTQPAIYLVSVLLGELLLENGQDPDCAAGHSLGEYSALTIAGAFNFSTGFKLVKIRAEAMYQAGQNSPGTMAAVIGMDEAAVTDLCREASSGNEIVVPANFNSPGQIVISGTVPAVKKAIEIGREFGAKKIVLLNVSGAFHSPLMTPAREALEKMLNEVEIQDVRFPVYANVTAEPTISSDDIRTYLIEQLEQPVQWERTVKNMVQSGVSSFLEVGPGKVLQGLNRRIDRRVPMSGVETYQEVMEIKHV